jgi:hypothetical protein
MEHLNHTIIFKTNTEDIAIRIDELIALFNERMKGETTPVSIIFHFFTSEEFPMTMEELSRFMDQCSVILENCKVEWDYATDSSLGWDIRLNIVISDRRQ